MPATTEGESAATEEEARDVTTVGNFQLVETNYYNLTNNCILSLNRTIDQLVFPDHPPKSAGCSTESDRVFSGQLCAGR